jgi:DNA-binding NtrC family response regulator
METLTKKIKVLTIDDEQNFTEEIHEYLQKTGFESYTANTVRPGLAILKKTDIDLMILDIRLPGANGLDVLKQVKEEYPKIEVIIVSAHGDMDSVILAMRHGALDYLRKPFRHVDFQIAIERTQKFILLNQKLQVMEEKNSLISQSLSEKIDRNFIGESVKIKQVLDLAMTASQFADTNVLITGESGTGKENVARIIHYASNRKDHVFCGVNSSAISESLLESEFFGHKKGSFTGAVSDKQGFFETTDGGTLFLDEIADMPINLQAKILRAIEEKKITRVGETHQIASNFRIIAATNHDVDQLVHEKKFRLDLMHRLNTLHIQIPPLRERQDDIEPLLKYFVHDFCVKLNKPEMKIDKKIVAGLRQYDFPGNVRELKNMTERAIILCKGDTLNVEDFPIKTKSVVLEGGEVEVLNLQENEIRLIRTALRTFSYNQKKASDALGITRDSLIRRMKKFNIKIKKDD